MKGEWEMRRRFSVAAAALALSVALTVPAYAGTWKYEMTSGNTREVPTSLHIMSGSKIMENIIILATTVL